MMDTFQSVSFLFLLYEVLCKIMVNFPKVIDTSIDFLYNSCGCIELLNFLFIFTEIS